MRKIELAEKVSSSILGFGCAPILGSVDGKTAHRAVSCALDLGITHYDLARSYGYGEAEKFMGKFLAGRRSGVTIATKFGIRANWKAALLKPLKPLARALKGRRSKQGNSPAPPPRPSLPVADRFHDRVPITAKAMRESLEESLRALRTDYIDIFFVHEPLSSITHVDELMAGAEDLKAAGKIRAVGLAFPWETVAMHQDYLKRFNVLQFNNSVDQPWYSEVRRDRGHAGNVFFSPLRGATRPAADVLSEMWTDFPSSVILCSMFKEEHIRKNVDSALKF